MGGILSDQEKSLDRETVELDGFRYTFEELSDYSDAGLTEFRVFDESGRSEVLVAKTKYEGRYERGEYLSNFMDEEFSIGGSLETVDARDAVELYQEILDNSQLE